MGKKPNISLNDKMVLKEPKKEDTDIPAAFQKDDKKNEHSIKEEPKHGQPSRSTAFRREIMSSQVFRMDSKKNIKPDNKTIPTTPARQIVAALDTPKLPKHASSPPAALLSSKTHHRASSETSFTGISEEPETPRRERIYPMSAKKANNLIEHGVHPFNPDESPRPATGQLSLSVMSNKRRPELESPSTPKKPRSGAAQSPPRPRSAGHGFASSPPGPGSALGKLAIRAKHRHRRFGYELPPKMEDLELVKPGIDPKPAKLERNRRVVAEGGNGKQKLEAGSADDAGRHSEMEESESVLYAEHPSSRRIKKEVVERDAKQKK